MDNSIYIALSRQQVLFRDMGITANNIANANTPGYHAEKMMFTDYIVEDGKSERIAFAQDISSYRDTTNGPMQITGNDFDLAIKGPGFFSIETAEGIRYTRAGNFQVGPDGMLSTASGNPVLDPGGGRLFMAEGDRNPLIGENGIIQATTPDGAVEERGQIGVFEFEDPQNLTRVNDQLFDTEQDALEAVNSRISQGAIEQSNVSPIHELVRTTELSRSTSSTAKFIEVMYDLQRKTSNSYARPAQN